MALAYRRDIDGLRAVAVISVVIYHAFPQALPGGFVGVDVFFVISGFLISSILFTSLDQGRFSFADFYGRRIRRIFPALILVLSTSFIIGWVVLLTDEMMPLGKHIAAGAGFVSNLVLMQETGYFDSAADTKILLHLWSLGVEEQFYIIYPVLLWVLARKRHVFLIMTGIIGVLSFGLNIEAVTRDPDVAFYAPQTRFWELMCGSVLAWLTLYRQRPDPSWSARLSITRPHLMSWLGCGLLAFGFVRIDQTVLFPGFWALIPVCGACLVIAAGERGWINRFVLSHPVFVWFGTISYPLYLWHWVLLTYPRIVLGEPPKRLLVVGLLALSVVLAWLTFLWLERPIRAAGSGRLRALVLVCLMGLAGLVGVATYLKGDQWLFKYRPGGTELAGDTGHLVYHRTIAERYVLCAPESIARAALTWEGFTRCMQSKRDRAIDIALIGDSHAEHLFLGMAEALPDHNIVFYIKGSPILADHPDYRDIYASVIGDRAITTVVLSMYWSSRMKRLPEGTTLEAEMIKLVDLFLAAQKRVVLLGDVPVFPSGPERCKRSYRKGDGTPCVMPKKDADQQRDAYHAALLRVVGQRPAVTYLPVDQHLCTSDQCSMVRAETLLYRDKNHLNLKGSSFVGRQIVEHNPAAFQ